MTTNNYTGRCRPGLHSLFIPQIALLLFSQKSEQKLGILVERQKNQRANKIGKKLFKQTHCKKLVELLTPTTKQLEEVNKSTKNLGKVTKKQILITKRPNWLLKILKKNKYFYVYYMMYL